MSKEQKEIMNTLKIETNDLTPNFELSNNPMDNLLRAMHGVKDKNIRRSSEFILDKEEDSYFKGLHKRLCDKPTEGNK